MWETDWMLESCPGRGGSGSKEYKGESATHPLLIETSGD